MARRELPKQGSVLNRTRADAEATATYFIGRGASVRITKIPKGTAMYRSGLRYKTSYTR